MVELRRFIEVDNHEAEKTANLERNSEAIKVVGPGFDREMLPDAAVRKGVDECTFGRCEKGMLRSFIDTTSVAVDGGSQFAKPSTRASRERNGRSCVMSSWK